MNNFELLAEQTIVNVTIKALRNKGYNTLLVVNETEALKKIIELIPNHQSVMRGSSMTLKTIGFTDYLKSNKHRWTDWHGLVHAEKDPIKRRELRKKTAFADYYVGSVNALTKSGEFLVASNTGSQLPHIAFTSPHLIFVVSTKKIVKNMIEAFERLEKHVYPLEDERMKKVHGSGSSINKIIIFRGEALALQRKVNIILVNKNLGF